MHIILGILGPIVTVLILLNRLAEAGIDIGGLNPFLWHRRRKWRKQYEGNPLFQIESPMDAAGILLVGAAKADGDISIEEKKKLLQLFESEFNLSAKDAAGLFISSAHLIGDGVDLKRNISKFLKPNKDNFSATQTQSLLELLEKVANTGGTVHPTVQQYLTDIQQQLLPKNEQSGSWENGTASS